MTTPTTAELLKYADLQMAAEAFFRKKGPGSNGTTLSPNALHFSLPQRLQFGFENTTRLGQERQIL
jgi:hypothetical protein